MGLRQPDVQGHETGLRAKADDGQQEQNARPCSRRRQPIKIKRSGALAQKQEQGQQKAVPRCMATR